MYILVLSICNALIQTTVGAHTPKDGENAQVSRFSKGVSRLDKASLAQYVNDSISEVNYFLF